MDNLTLDFMGTRVRETEIVEKQFLQRLLYRKNISISFSTNYQTIKRTFILNMPGIVAKMLEANSKLKVSQTYQISALQNFTK